MDYISEDMLREVMTGEYEILIRVVSSYEDKIFQSEDVKLNIEDFNLEDLDAVINERAGEFIRSSFHDYPLGTPALANNKIIITKSFEDSSLNKEMPPKTLSMITFGLPC